MVTKKKYRGNPETYETPNSKWYGQSKYVLARVFTNKADAKREAEVMREHNVPSRVAINDLGNYAVYFKASSHYKPTSRRKLKRDWGYDLTSGRRRRKK